MPQIREIGVQRIGVPDISVGQPIPPPVLPTAPPVTSAKYPVIEMPGCVRARIAKGSGVQTFEDDPRGNVTLCDGAVPVYDAPDYRPRDFTWVQPPQADTKKPEPKTPAAVPSPSVPVKLWDPVPVGQVVNNYVPDVGPTVSVAVTAAFATTAAILSKPIASVLQKLAKPITKKVVKKLLLKKEKPVSLRERILAQRDRNRALMALRRAVGK